MTTRNFTAALMDNSQPLVSIGIPTYNRAKDLRRAVQSVLNQDYSNIELIISDNASTDDTEALCRQAVCKDKRVRYFRQTSNQGMAANFSEVLKKSTGEFFMWLGDDDFLDKSYIRLCLEYLQEHPDFSLACGKAVYFCEGKILGEGLKIDLLDNDRRERVLKYYRMVGENGTFYGVMNRHHVLSISFGQDVLKNRQKEILGQDWLMIGEIGFLGKIKTIETTSVFRSFSGTSRNASELVKGLNLPAFLAKMIWVNISYTILKYILWKSPIYKPLGIFGRISLGIKASWAVFYRCSFSPWKSRRKSNWLYLIRAVNGFLLRKRIDKRIKMAQKMIYTNELVQAERLYQQNLIEDPKNIVSLHDMGIIAFQKGQYQRAAEWLLKAITVKPDYAEAFNNLGVVCYSLGRLEEAMGCYDSALKFKPAYAEAHYNRGLVFRERGQEQEAIFSIERAIEFKPGYAEARKELKRLRSKKSDGIHLTTIPLKISSPVESVPRIKMAYIDLPFHQKTKSTSELIEIFKRYYHVDIYWDEGNLDFKKMSEQEYDAVVLFQRLYGLRRLKHLNIKNIIMIPMCDDVLDVTKYYWKHFENVRFLNFSKNLHDKLQRLGMESKYIQYYVAPSTLPEPRHDSKGLSGFFWQRTNYIRWTTIKRLIHGTPFEKFHLHSAVDPPNHVFEKPTDEERQVYNISISDWFQGREDYLSIVNASTVFFAPRLFEGIGMSFLEAMALGKCVVAPNLPTMNEYIRHGENGLLYDPVNPVPLDFSQAAELGKRARISVENGYLAWKEREKELVELICRNSSSNKIGFKEAVL